MKISDIFRRYRIRPLKRLGQNFLVDNNIRDKICTALDLNRSDRVLEIGAGFGVLSERLADTCSHLWAVEKDAKLCAILKKEILPGRDNITVLHDDILQIRLGTLAGKHTIKVVGNLPYYITTKILFYLVAYRTSISSAIITMQKEVGQRLLAMPGTKNYGRLTVGVRFFAEVEKLFEIKANSFLPAPEVTSIVVKITFRHNKDKRIDEALFLDVVAALFQERRKNVRNALCLLKSREITKAKAEEVLAGCTIAFTRRAEELMLKDFIALTRYISNNCVN